MVDFLEPFCCDVSVKLGCRETFVTEEIFHGFQVRPPVQQMRREGVTKDVRAFPFEL